MKKTNILMVSMCALFIMSSQSCSNDQGTTPASKTLKGESTVLISFENFIGDNKIKINDNIDYMTSSEGQTIKKVTAFDYIVSNFTLIDETGKPFFYPKDQSYFIINEECKSTEVHLDKVPAGKYTSMTFTLGVDSDKWNTGSEQDELWKKANSCSMTWNWLLGYKHLRFEGSLTDETSSLTDDEPHEPFPFKLHIGDDDIHKILNARTITLNFPKGSAILVSEDLQSTIHLHCNAEKLLDGKNKNKIHGTGPFSTMFGTKKYADNFEEMFTIEKVESKETAKK